MKTIEVTDEYYLYCEVHWLGRCCHLGLARGRPSTHTRNKLVLLVQFMVSDHNNTVFTEITKCLEMLVGLLIFVIDCSSA